MVSSSCVNPSLSYMAMTARACAYAVEELKKQNITFSRKGAKKSFKEYDFRILLKISLALGGVVRGMCVRLTAKPINANDFFILKPLKR